MKIQFTRYAWFIVSACVVILDQCSKHWAMLHLPFHEPIALLPMLNLTLAFNNGVAFSILNNSGAWHYWFLTSVSILLSVGLSCWLLFSKTQKTPALLAISLILGGALGNLIDRLLYSHVIDFIDIYYASYHWPVFNLADSAICIGAILMIKYSPDGDKSNLNIKLRAKL